MAFEAIRWEPWGRKSWSCCGELREGVSESVTWWRGKYGLCYPVKLERSEAIVMGVVGQVEAFVCDSESSDKPPKFLNRSKIIWFIFLKCFHCCCVKINYLDHKRARETHWEAISKMRYDTGGSRDRRGCIWHMFLGKIKAIGKAFTKGDKGLSKREKTNPLNISRTR